MKWYPWLLKPYKTIIQQHQIKKAHHAILIKTQKGMGVFQLIWFVSKWLLCLHPTGIKFCNKCHGCQLMLFKNHPDWHALKSEKNDIFNVDSIRIINDKIFKCSQQNGAKIIFLSDISKLTESATNAFLKTLEEPPKNTWFFLVNYNNVHLKATLHSRCLVYRLLPPQEQNSLTWLKKNNLEKNISHLTALRINQGSPISAKQFINGKEWIDRKNFYKYLFEALKIKDLVKLLSLLCKKNTLVKINWICLLLFDAIKLNFKENKFLINCDQIEMIEFLSFNYTNIILDNSIRTWMKCRYRLSNILGVNNELLLLEQLLVWERILNFSFIS